MSRIDIAELNEFLHNLKSSNDEARSMLGKVQEVTNAYATDTSLKGKAIETSQAYFDQTYSVICKSLIEALDESEERLERYIQEFGEQVDSSYNARIDAEMLQEAIFRLAEIKRKQEDLLQRMSASTGTLHEGEQQRLRTQFTAALEQEKILERYIAFEQSHGRFFDSFSELVYCAGKAIRELAANVTFNSQTGTYDIGKLDTNKFHALQKFLPKKKKYNFNEYEIRWNGATHILLKGDVVDAEATAAYNDTVAKGELPKVSNQATESAEEINAVVNALKKGQDPITGQEISKAQSFGITIGLVYMYVGGKYKGRKIKLPKSALENLEKQQAFKDKEVGGADIPNPNVGIVQSRVNLAENPTRFSPSKNAGMKHVRNRHYNPSKNAGQFTIPESDLKNILQSKQVVNTPVKQIESGDFERVIDIGKNMGTVKPSLGGQTTTWIKVITDKAGNIITTYPVSKP
ncbi:T7SS effector LXG polymorphic toxin [Listeria marthii]|uniref:T7SS effector LXG polymorphic toxin n=1 Tax=Listeria marthii TaxID=529731 RepID=UPI001888EF5F|nr:T7SS effector LXG polymorphic toxin [Listeria marthii]MBF2504242.1 hypothetical protein [Listeria marthii]